MSDNDEQEMPQSVEETTDVVLEPASLTAEDRGEVEQEQEQEYVSTVEQESNAVEATNGGSGQDEAQTNGHTRQSFDLPIRNKESEHTEKVVSAIEEDPASLEANGVVDKDQAITDREENGMSMDEVENTHYAPVEDSKDNASSAKTDNTTPAKSPHVPTYLKSTASASSRASPKASPAHAPVAKTPQSISKLNNNLRKASATKPASVGPAKETSASTSTDTKVKSPVRTARLSHLTAPTAASAAKKDVPPTAPVSSKSLGRAASVRSKKPVEGSHFLAPTRSSALRKDLPLPNGSSVQKPTSTRTSLTTNPAQPASRKTSASVARPPPSISSTTAQAGSRIPSGNSSSGKPASGSFLERMTRPTAASAGHKADAVKSPSSGKNSGGLGRIASMKSKLGVKKKMGGVAEKDNERKHVPAGSIAEEDVEQSMTNGASKEANTHEAVGMTTTVNGAAD